MSQYLNNPDAIFPVRIPISDIKERNGAIFTVLKEIVPEPWIDIEDISISSLSGGITNALYLVKGNNKEGCNQYAIVRIFGEGTDIIIDRNTENNVFSSLSTLKEINTPIFYGLFENGRIEGYVQDSITLTPADLSSEHYLPLISKAVSNFSCLQIASIPSDIFLWRKIETFFDIARDVTFEDETKSAALRSLDIPLMRSQYGAFKSYISSQKVGDNFFSLGKLFASEIVLSHNDLLSGNILYTSSVDKQNLSRDPITLIDYEYCGYNYRGYDLANHFCEFCGFDFDVENNFPSSELRGKFYVHYIRNMLGKSANSDYLSRAVSQGLNFEDELCSHRIAFLKGFDERVCEMTAASHIFWGTWSVVQASVSKLDFDYLDYARLRYHGYHYHRKVFDFKW